MTIPEIARQLHDMSKGKINGESFTLSQLEKYLKNWFRPGVVRALDTRVVLEITLPDGNWFFSVERYSNRPDGFDYFIPDTRSQEDRLIKALMG